MSFQELSIIKALKIGTVPAVGCTQLAVGRDPEIAEAKRILAFVAEGGAEVRFLRGDYGSGKTFVCSLFRELAFDRKYASSILNLTREVPFGRRDLVLKEILNGLRTPTSGADSALREIVEAWLNLHDPAAPFDQNAQMREANRRVGAIDSQLAMALRGYHDAYIEGSDVLMEAGLAWIRGEPITAEARSGLRLVGKLTPEQAFKRLRSILSLMLEVGFSGLVVLLDESESIMRLASPQRMAAYTAIREIVDSCAVEFGHCWFVFAGTERWFTDEFSGVAQYDALWQRIRNTQVESVRDLRQPIIRLEPLGEASLVALANRVRDIHGRAYSWDASAGFSNAEMRAYIARVATRFGNISEKPRGFLKALVDTLDARQQGLTDPDEVAVDAAVTAIEQQDASLNDVVLAAI